VGKTVRTGMSALLHELALFSNAVKDFAVEVEASFG
jgi:hypothetical protein